MNVFVYSMRDIKSDFMAPTYSSNDAVAMRNFESAIEQSHDVLFTHRSDFQLFRIGSFDTDTGVLTPEKVPILFKAGTDVVGCCTTFRLCGKAVIVLPSLVKPSPKLNAPPLLSRSWLLPLMSIFGL